MGWNEYNINLDENLTSLVNRLKTKKYKQIPVRRVYIPKENGDKRSLGISAIENKIAKKSVTKILESI